MEISKFSPSDLEEMGEPPPAEVSSLLSFESYTARHHGKVIACAGIIPLWNGRSQAWSVISKDIGPSGMVLLTRAVGRFLSMQSGRIEMYVIEGFKAGYRWADMLGFRQESVPMIGFFPNGGSAVLFARVN